MKRKHEMIC